MCLTGLSTTQASLFHVEKFQMEDNISVLANAQVNPTSKSIERFRKTWLTKHVGGFDKLSIIESLDKYKKDHPEIIIEYDLSSESSFCIMLIKPLMLRVYEYLKVNINIFLFPYGRMPCHRVI